MKVCERCGGSGHIYALLCDACRGTGMILLGPEGADRYAEMIAAARRRAAREGWQELVWEGEPGHARTVRRVVTIDREQVA